MKVAVVGAGIAGLAAGAIIRESKFDLTFYAPDFGASAFSCGAVDFAPWPEAGETRRARFGGSQLVASESISALLRDLAVSLGARVVATQEGLIRPADGCHISVLDLSQVRSGVVGVLDVGRDDWPAQSLAESWSRQHWARETGTRFRTLALSDVFSEAEKRYPLTAFCQLLDEERRWTQFASALKSLAHEHHEFRGFLCGPWLGTKNEVFAASGVEIPLLGEALNPPGGPLGLRFERAARTVVEAWGVELVQQSVMALRQDAQGTLVTSEASGVPSAPRRFDGVIVATGGLVGGGVSWSGEAGVAAGRSVLDPRPDWLSGSWDGTDPLARGGREFFPGATMGVRPSQPAERIQFAGDVLGSRPEHPTGTWGSALLSGASAGRVLTASLQAHHDH